ncbi:MAG TPA: radical SAM protein [Vicinamibacterales bacterium]|nr:radical SAM protein [Vicinamibacterales bacterium]HPW20728.1 radical SAM protein [Vicinamibacterales bacterium]
MGERQPEAASEARNVGRKTRLIVLPPAHPNTDAIARDSAIARGEASKVDVLLVNPPSPDGAVWIRSQHRVGRRSRENMLWPQVSLAQMAALLQPTYSIRIIDAIAERMDYRAFEDILRRERPRYYVTQLTGPTLQSDMYGAFLAKANGATTIAFGTHITPMPTETLRPFPALDYGLRGEPDLTLCDLIDHLEGRQFDRPALLEPLFRKHDPLYQPRALATLPDGSPDLSGVRGLVWRRGQEIVVNPDRPFIADLDDLPMPLHHLLPFNRYLMPLLKGPFTFIVTSRGCPAGCTFCIKHVSYGPTMRMRSPSKLVEELQVLDTLGVHNIHMYADLFTVNRDQVVGLCRGILEAGLRIRWTCNSRVDFVDREMLELMARSGCHFISWGLESGNAKILAHARKGVDPDRARQSLTLAHEAGIRNWGYFIIGLPGETEETIRQTIAFSKSLPLDIALFHIAAPHPGTPFFHEVVRNGWFRKGVRWEEVDMDESTVLDYPGLPAERLEYWQKRAFREWAMRPGPMLTYLRMVLSDTRTVKSALSVGLQHLGWAKR